MNTIKLPDFTPPKPDGNPPDGSTSVVPGKYGRHCNVDNPATYKHTSRLAAFLLATPRTKMFTDPITNLRFVDFTFTVGGSANAPVETIRMPLDDGPRSCGEIFVDLTGEDDLTAGWAADPLTHPLFNGEGCLVTPGIRTQLIDFFGRLASAPQILTNDQVTGWLVSCAVTDHPEANRTPDFKDPASAMDAIRQVSQLASDSMEDARRMRSVQTPLGFISQSLSRLTQSVVLRNHDYLAARELFVQLVTLLDEHLTTQRHFYLFAPSTPTAERNQLMRAYFRESVRCVITAYCSSTVSVTNCLQAISDSITNQQQENTPNVNQ